MSRLKAEIYDAGKEAEKAHLLGLFEKILPHVIVFILCILASKATVLGKFSPFGVAFAASFGAGGVAGLLPYIGVMLGYMTGGFDNLNYILAVAIIFLLKSTVLKKLKLTRNDSVSAGIAGVTFLLTSFYPLMHFGFLFYDVILKIAEALICMSFAYFYSVAQPVIKVSSLRAGGLSQKELAAVVLSMSVFLLSLQNFGIFGISFARIAAVFIVLLLAYYGGMAYGSMAGVLLGLTMSLGSPSFSFIVGAYAFGGLLAGIFAETGRLGASVAFIAANAVITIFFNGSTETLIGIYEILASSVLFIALPKRFTKWLSGFFMLTEGNSESYHSDKLRSLFLTRMKNAAESFKEISETLTSHSESEITDARNLNELLNRSAEKVCKNCRLSSYCWGAAYNDTANVFNGLSPVFRKKGKLDIEDLPGYFASRCIKKDKLLNEINICYIENVARSSSKKMADENRKVLAGQYDGISKIIENMASELQKNVVFDTRTEERVKSYLMSCGAKKAEALCYIDNDNVMNIEGRAQGLKSCPDAYKLRDTVNSFSDHKLELCDINFDGGYLSFKLMEKDCYAVSCVKIFRNKNGETCCGDSSSSFRTAGGKYVISISDGMGSGEGASNNSTLTIRLLEKLIKAGFDRESALRLINSAIMLKSNDEAFVTVDLTVINLINGIAEFIKAGAAPTFLKRGEKVYELGCSSLPAGILSDVQLEKTICKLRGGDMLIMVSDGVSALGAQTISQKCSAFKGESAVELADALLSEAARQGKGIMDDDMTVAVALFKNAS